MNFTEFRDSHLGNTQLCEQIILYLFTIIRLLIQLAYLRKIGGSTIIEIS